MGDGEYTKTPDDIRKRLSELKEAGKLEGLEREADKIDGLLHSPDNILIAIDGLEELEKKVRAREDAYVAELRPYLHKMEIWTKQGFDTSGLATVLRQEHRDMEAVDRLFWRFEKMVERVVNMEKELLQLSVPDYEVEIEALRELMTDPKRFGEVARRYHHLVHAIRAHKREGQRRGELRETIERYRDMGFKVDSVQTAFDGDLQSLEVAVSELEDAVIILQDLQSSLEDLDPTGREERFEYVRRLLYNPEKVADAMDELDALERGA